MEIEPLCDALKQTFAHRGTHPVPVELAEAPERWRTPYQELAEANRLQWTSLDDVHQAVKTFLTPALAGEHGRWDPTSWAWDVRKRDRDAAEWVFERAELRGRVYVAQLRGPDGSRRDLEGYRPGNDGVRAGDVVRLGDGGALVMVRRGQDRDRGR